MRLPLAAFTLAFLASPVIAQEPGNLWDVTTSMEGGGMQMPAQSRKVCVAANTEGP